MRENLKGAGGTLLLAGFGAAVAGFHPYAEDGGVYLAGVKKLLDPGLYPVGTEFVTEHLRFSLFAPMLAELASVAGGRLEDVVLTVYLLSTWATLYAGWMVARLCLANEPGRWGAVTLLACWLTLPIAGTSLMLMDPYVTARSLSTPMVLLAMAWGMDRRWFLCGLALVGGAVMHPLMAAYGAAAVVLISVRSWRWYAGLCGLAVTVAAVLVAMAPTETADYVRVVITRYYWFLARWQWYEWLGLAGPMIVLALLGRRQQRRGLAQAMLVLGAIAVVVAVLFAREGMGTHIVARLQPLRCFQIIYLVMILLLGGWLGEHWLKRHAWRWGLLMLTMGGVMLLVQRDIYGHSAHIEWPGTSPRNGWERAFLWVRANTPRDALFAMDAHYITQGKGEDAQCFRAMAERSALPDYSKDGGEASITPALTKAWVRGQAAQTGLAEMSDAQRAAHLRPMRVSWVLLEAGNATAWDCPYQNETVRVCRVPVPGEWRE